MAVNTIVSGAVTHDVNLPSNSGLNLGAFPERITVFLLTTASDTELGNGVNVFVEV
jgi:hypothetical protein